MASHNTPMDHSSTYRFPVENVDLIRKGYDTRFGGFASDFQKVEQEDYTGPTPKDDSLVRPNRFFPPHSPSEMYPADG